MRAYCSLVIVVAAQYAKLGQMPTNREKGWGGKDGSRLQDHHQIRSPHDLLRLVGVCNETYSMYIQFADPLYNCQGGVGVERLLCERPRNSRRDVGGIIKNGEYIFCNNG